MAKVQQILIIVTVTFIIGMILILIIGVNYIPGQSFEKTFDDNGGLIWGCTTILAISIFGMQVMNGVHGAQLKKCAEENSKKNLQIEILSNTIIKNQQEGIDLQKAHVDQLATIKELISDRSEGYNLVTKKMDQLYTLILKKEANFKNDLSFLYKQIARIKATIKRQESIIKNNEKQIKKIVNTN